MTDERVDRLLADLDRALSVQPSPAFVARVRRQVAPDEPSTWAGVRLVAGAAIVVTVCGVTYATWLRMAPGPLGAVRPAEMDVTLSEPKESSAPNYASATPPPQVESVVPEQKAGGRMRSVAPKSVTAVAIQEPVVIVSPAIRLGVEQLQAAIIGQRITAESFVNNATSIEPTILVPSVIAVQPFDLNGAIETTPAQPTGGARSAPPPDEPASASPQQVGRIA